jgi:chaperone required for assembly of F1-ATPase
MSGWASKRFWTRAEATPAEQGWEVRLDGRSVRTPARAPLVLPALPLAEAIAEEWDAQTDLVDPASMPMTRAANSAIDKVTPQRAAVAAMLADYAGTDMLCYRADSPAELAAQQAAAWDPFLDWAADRFGARLVVTVGVVPVAQPPEALERLAAEVDRLDPFALTAFHDLVALSGSLVLGLAAISGRASGEELWDVSRIDEDWQARLWGVDDEAAEAAARRRADFLNALRFHALSRRG